MRCSGLANLVVIGRHDGRTKIVKIGLKLSPLTLKYGYQIQILSQFLMIQ